MSIENYSREELKEISMIELATMILKSEKKAVSYHELFQRVSEMKGYTEAEKEVHIAQFYTDLNIDGRFLPAGSGLWGLKEWYPVEKIDEEIAAAPKKKKKKKTKTTKKTEVVEDLDEDLDEDPLDFDEAEFNETDDALLEGEDIDEDLDDSDETEYDDDDQDLDEYEEDDDEEEEEEK